MAFLIDASEEPVPAPEFAGENTVYISARTGEALRYDEKRKAFDNREANKLLSREYRNGWKMPKF